LGLGAGGAPEPAEWVGLVIGDRVAGGQGESKGRRQCGGGITAARGIQIRRPKPETRKKAEIRRPKAKVEPQGRSSPAE
jgi:hypothetical protein